MIYVHIPLCKSFCTYCDFYSEICTGDDAERFADAVIEEINSRRGEPAGGLNTLYIGGGTPSVLPLSVLERIVRALPPGPYDEFTVEVNPEDIMTKGAGYVKGLRSLGVNRISMGVQSLSDDILRWMNRRHSAAGALEAFRILREGGIGNISVDVIIGISQLLDGVLEDTLRRLVAMGPEHFSCYQLSVEEGSELEEMVSSGRYSEASDEQCRRQYELVCRVLGEAGYRHYEISSWAQEGFESKHNSGYWQRVPYLGFGPGAHSFDGVRRSWNSRSLSGYTRSFETLTPEEAAEERIMLALRTSDGIPFEDLPRETAARLISEGLLVHEGPRIRIPEDRFFTSDDIIRQLI